MISRSIRRIAVVIGLSLMLFAMTACEEKIEQPPQGTPEPPQETVVEDRYPDWAIGNFKGSVGIESPGMMDMFLASDGKMISLFGFVNGAITGEAMTFDISTVELRLENDSVLTIDYAATESKVGIVMTREDGGMHVRIMMSSPDQDFEVSGLLVETDEPVPNLVQRIVIDGKDGDNPGTIYVDVGEERTLTYTTYPEDAAPGEFIWESDLPGNISIDETTGRLEVKNASYATGAQITVSGTGKLSLIEDSCYVMVSKPIESIEISCLDEGRTFHVGKSFMFTRQFLPENSFANYEKWESSDTSVVMIEDGGYAQAVGEGKATITVTARGVTSNEIEIEVIGIDSVTLSESQHEMQLGETFQLDAAVDPDYGYDKSRITWTSDNPDVAKVENGLVTALAEGTANITATADGAESQACRITVLDPFDQLPVDSFHAPEWIVGEYVSDTPRPYEINLFAPIEMPQYLDIDAGSLQNLVDCGDALYDHLAYGKPDFMITKQEANHTKWNIYYQWERLDSNIVGEIRLRLVDGILTMEVEDSAGLSESFTFRKGAVPEKPVLGEGDIDLINNASFLLNADEYVPLPSGVDKVSQGVYSFTDYEFSAFTDDVFTVTEGTVGVLPQNSYIDVRINGHDIKWGPASYDEVSSDASILYSYVYDGMNLQLPVLWTS